MGMCVNDATGCRWGRWEVEIFFARRGELFLGHLEWAEQRGGGRYLAGVEGFTTDRQRECEAQAERQRTALYYIGSSLKGGIATNQYTQTIPINTPATGPILFDEPSITTSHIQYHC